MSVVYHSFNITGKIVHPEISLENIVDYVRSAIYSYYDQFKQSTESSIDSDNIFFGDPPVIASFPSVAVIPISEEFVDEPQETGAEMRANVRVIFYTTDDFVNTDNVRRNLRMGLALRRLFQWNRNLHPVSAPTTSRVYQIELSSPVDYSDIFKENQGGERIGLMGGVMELQALYYENGY